MLDDLSERNVTATKQHRVLALVERITPSNVLRWQFEVRAAINTAQLCGCVDDSGYRTWWVEDARLPKQPRAMWPSLAWHNAWLTLFEPRAPLHAEQTATGKLTAMAPDGGLVHASL